MVFTRASAMDSKRVKNKSIDINTGIGKSKMKVNNKSSNAESEDDEQNTLATTSTQGGSTGSSIKVTLKKTRSCSTSSRESAQSFEVVKSVLPTSECISEEEDGENKKDSELEKTSDQQNFDVNENEKESEEESQNANSSGDDEDDVNDGDDSDVDGGDVDGDDGDTDGGNVDGVDVDGADVDGADVDGVDVDGADVDGGGGHNEIENIEISSDDSQESFTEMLRSNQDVSVKQENNVDTKVSFNTVVNLKTEEAPQTSTVVKNEDVKVKRLKEEPLKEPDDECEIVPLKSEASQPQNGVEKKENKEQVREQKFNVKIRSMDDLAAPRTVNLLSVPPIERSSFLTQNGSPFPSTYINISCDVCGIQFDSSELLSDHKAAMKHYKCSYKDCELVAFSSQQEYIDHQRLLHNIMPSPVQQLAHQVQRLPAMGFDPHLTSGVPPLPENLSPHGVPNMYTQSLRMPNQVPMQRSMRPMVRSNMPPHMMSMRGRGTVPRATRGRPPAMATMRGSSIKRPASMPMRPTTPAKRMITDRNSYTNNMNKTPAIVRSISESLTKSITTANKAPTPNQQDVVNLFSKRGLTISTVDSGKNVSLPAGLSLNSAVSIIPTSPHKVSSNNSPKRVSSTPNRAHNQNVDTVDLTGPEKPKKFWPCEICSKTYTSIETLYEHISNSHKSVTLPFKCNLCSGSFPSAEVLNRHKTSLHKTEVNTNIPFVIPILDLQNPSTLSRLRSMGVTNYVPVAQLDNQNGQFGMPIMSVARPGTVEGLKYTNFFNLGCVRKL